MTFIDGVFVCCVWLLIITLLLGKVCSEGVLLEQ